MLKVLITAPTKTELNPLIKTKFGEKDDINFLVSGVGVLASAFHLTHYFATNKVDIAIQVGVCGCYDRDIKLGRVFKIASDQMLDVGRLDDDGSKIFSFKDLGLKTLNHQTDKYNKITNESVIYKSLSIPEKNACTVNLLNVRESNYFHVITKMNNLTLETSEGYAFHFVCDQMNVPYVQIRSVSNYAFDFNKNNWGLSNAINSYMDLLLSSDILTSNK